MKKTEDDKKGVLIGEDNNNALKDNIYVFSDEEKNKIFSMAKKTSLIPGNIEDMIKEKSLKYETFYDELINKEPIVENVLIDIVLEEFAPEIIQDLYKDLDIEKLILDDVPYFTNEEVVNILDKSSSALMASPSLEMKTLGVTGKALAYGGDCLNENEKIEYEEKVKNIEKEIRDIAYKKAIEYGVTATDMKDIIYILIDLYNQLRFAVFEKDGTILDAYVINDNIKGLQTNREIIRRRNKHEIQMNRLNDYGEMVNQKTITFSEVYSRNHREFINNMSLVDSIMPFSEESINSFQSYFDYINNVFNNKTNKQGSIITNNIHTTSPSGQNILNDITNTDEENLTNNFLPYIQNIDDISYIEKIKQIEQIDSPLTLSDDEKESLINSIKDEIRKININPQISLNVDNMSYEDIISEIKNTFQSQINAKLAR